MNLMDSLFDEFQDDGAVAKMDERAVVGWIEVWFAAAVCQTPILSF